MFYPRLYHFVGIGQARPQLQATLMQRMTDVLSRMLNDPMTRAALSAGGEDSLDQESQRQDEVREGGAGENSNVAMEEGAPAEPANASGSNK